MVADTPVIVLDTNVALDWLWFRNPHCALLGAALETGRLRWIVGASMRDEMQRVLQRSRFDGWRPQAAELWRAWDAACTAVGDAPSLAPSSGLRCSDPDDQKFIDLAIAHRARWLVSRDRAVLKLARRAATVGLAILAPEAWRDSWTVSPTAADSSLP